MTSYADSVLPQLRGLPMPLAALLLQQAERYEVMFPREQKEIAGTLERLRLPRTDAAQTAVDSFRALKVPPPGQLPFWESKPAAYVEALTAWMWSSGQLGAFRQAAQLLLPEEHEAPGTQVRAVVIVYDPSLKAGRDPDLFRRLWPAGTLHTNVDAEATAEPLQQWLQSRVQSHKEPYAHWMICGGHNATWAPPEPVVRLAYDDLRPARLALLRKMNEARHEPASGGPEGLRSAMLAMRAQDMGMEQQQDSVLQAFATDVLVGGSGTQLYSTTFVQWSLREALRRARPSTVLAHFSPRNGSAPMDVRLSNPEAEPPPDPAGSLVDAEMHTYMTYVNLLRLPAGDKPFYLVWHPGYGQALKIGPGIAAGAIHQDKTSMSGLLTSMA